MLSQLLKITSIVLICIKFSSCKKTTPSVPENIGNNNLTPYFIEYPNYFPTLSIPADNQTTIEGVELGRHLYYDTILSNTGKSCSSCHNSNYSFSSPTANSLPHVNLGWSNNFLWNGKVTGSLETVMQFEVEHFFQTNISKLNSSQFYAQKFKKIFNTAQITEKQVEYVLAQFFRTMVSSNSLCDKYFQHKQILNQSQLNGFIIFTTEKGDCFHCHSLGLFTDNNFHNIGIDSVFNGANLGRYNVTQNLNDIGLFKTPTLRNIELTAPYMHDGRFQTLDEVIEHYNSGVLHSTTLDPIMTKPSKQYGLGLTANQKQDLIAFLKTLTDTIFTKNPQLQKP